MAKSLAIPLDPSVKELRELPYTISYVIRKRKQIDNLAELPKEKRPPEEIIWDKGGDELDKWMDKVFDHKNTSNKSDTITIDLDSIEE